MNKLELRYHVAQFLNGLNQPAAIGNAVMVDATPADPVWALDVTVHNPYDMTNPEATRTFRLTFEES